ncbi:DUF2493 domain-containing protein [Nonomuraea gerenzanensis]|uniref:Phage chromosome segregation protein n=1 Tax=Nonomuraea gerenzanensis TaxID=93944 RepID=A0A1M4BL95_9ACTN|nr:DUF2493 domain-containing protein [Nonomuraea gerenzanensis]UBU10009.1 DUF2493 domain-containing protein [Nonomuraea gerenzanensis]SAP16282.1 Phage chromosome segregation protein [Nonomuraea gerenzanensis]
MRNELTEAQLLTACTRCGHQRAVHTGGASSWGWGIYEPTWAGCAGWCSEVFCSCTVYTDDPAAAPAPPVAFTPPTPHQPQPCGFFAHGDRRRCGTHPARLYANGWRCASHSPSVLAGRAEPQGGSCAPGRHYCPPEARCSTWEWQQQPWRLLATGGRDRTDKTRIGAALDDVLRLHPVLTVVHGACYPKPERGVRPDRSADWLVHLWCERAGVKEETHPADWRRHGRAAGPIRNGEMVALGADEALAFPGAGPGTYDCMRKASAAGITVRPIWPHTPKAVTS